MKNLSLHLQALATTNCRSEPKQKTQNGREYTSPEIQPSAPQCNEEERGTNKPTALGFSGSSVDTGHGLRSAQNLIRQRPQLGPFSSSSTFIQKSTLYLFHKNWYHCGETFHLFKSNTIQ